MSKSNKPILPGSSTALLIEMLHFAAGRSNDPQDKARLLKIGEEFRQQYEADDIILRNVDLETELMIKFLHIDDALTKMRAEDEIAEALSFYAKRARGIAPQNIAVKPSLPALQVGLAGLTQAECAKIMSDRFWTGVKKEYGQYWGVMRLPDCGRIVEWNPNIRSWVPNKLMSLGDLGRIANASIADLAKLAELEASRAKYLYNKAEGFALAAHINQRRKYSNEPYINHCLEVAELVFQYTEDYEIAAAAVMHDVLEDTAITEAQMRQAFGDYITNMVLCITDVSKPTDGNRAVRKAIDLDHLRGCSDEAANIKFADLISNTASIVNYDKDFAKIYLPEKRRVLEVLQGRGNAVLYEEALRYLEKAEQHLDWRLRSN